MKTNHQQIIEAIEAFLKDWDRQDWMSLHGERADQSDDIAEGVIDPYDARGRSYRILVGRTWDSWQAVEGWLAIRVGDDLFMNWYRLPSTRLRHQRDLYVLVERGFFTDDDKGEG